MSSTDVEVVELGARRPAGWLATSYEDRYERIASSRIDGGPAVALAPLRSALNWEIPLPRGPFVRFTCYPDAEGSWPARHSLGHVADPATDPSAIFDARQNGLVLRVVVRRAPYASFQGLLVPLDERPQEADPAFFRVAFAYLRALGSAYTGTFNVGGRTHDRFHAQFFKGSAPLWDHLASGSVGPGSGQRERISRGVWRSDVLGWPCRCFVFGSAEPSPLASILAEQIRELRSRGMTYDLSFRWERGELWVLLFPRASSTDLESHLYPPERLELGGFGALELAGWVLSIRDQGVCRRLAARPEELGRRYEDALTRIETGWPPPDRSTAGIA